MALLAFWIRLVLALVPWHAAGIDTPELPAYELVVSREGGDPASSGGLRVSTEGFISLLLRPRTPAVGPVAVLAFVGHGDEGWRSPVVFERFSAGTFALRARVGDLPGLLPGRREITLLVGRPWDLPKTPLLATANHAPDERVRVLATALDVVAAP